MPRVTVAMSSQWCLLETSSTMVCIQEKYTTVLDFSISVGQ